MPRTRLQSGTFRSTPFLAVWLACLLLAGCWPQHTVSDRHRALSPEERNFLSVWESSRDVLQKYGFVLDRQDRRDGVITTYAMVGSQAFEVWRDDSATIFHMRENTVQTILRAAKVRIFRRDETDTYDFDVEILAARSVTDPPQLTDSSQAMDMSNYQRIIGGAGNDNVMGGQLKFDDLKPRQVPMSSPAETEEPPLPDPEDIPPLVPLGRDRDLEAKVIDDIRQARSSWDPNDTSWVSWRDLEDWRAHW